MRAKVSNPSLALVITSMSLLASKVQGTSCRAAHNLAGRSFPSILRVQQSVTTAFLFSSPVVVSAVSFKATQASRSFVSRAAQPVCAASATMEATPMADNPLLQVRNVEQAVAAGQL